MGRARFGLLIAIAWGTASACASHAAYRPMRTGPGPGPELVAAIYLVGDAGLDSPGRDAVLGHLRGDLQRHLARHPTIPALVAFLGDNIYELGARPDHRAQDIARLSAQVRAVADAPTVRGVFLPGNHDWGRGAPDPEGRTAVQIQQQWIDQVEGSRNVGFLPADECPGPETVRVAGDVHIVFMDSEWLLRRPEDRCGGADLFYPRLAAELGRLSGERVVLAAHHPMATGGPHGGNVGFLYQAPVVYYLAAKSGLSVQDLASGRYGAMITGLEGAIEASGARPMVFAAGHDHSLQVIRMEEAGEPHYQLISGSASKSSHVGAVEGTRFATPAHGYMRLDFGPETTRVVTFAMEEEAGALRPVFACELSAGPVDPCVEAPAAEAR